MRSIRHVRLRRRSYTSSLRPRQDEILDRGYLEWYKTTSAHVSQRVAAITIFLNRSIRECDPDISRVTSRRPHTTADLLGRGSCPKFRIVALCDVGKELKSSRIIRAPTHVQEHTAITSASGRNSARLSAHSVSSRETNCRMCTLLGYLWKLDPVECGGKRIRIGVWFLLTFNR